MLNRLLVAFLIKVSLAKHVMREDQPELVFAVGEDQQFSNGQLVNPNIDKSLSFSLPGAVIKFRDSLKKIHAYLLLERVMVLKIDYLFFDCFL